MTLLLLVPLSAFKVSSNNNHQVGYNEVEPDPSCEIGPDKPPVLYDEDPLYFARRWAYMWRMQLQYLGWRAPIPLYQEKFYRLYNPRWNLHITKNQDYVNVTIRDWYKHNDICVFSLNLSEKFGVKGNSIFLLTFRIWSMDHITILLIIDSNGNGYADYLDDFIILYMHRDPNTGIWTMYIYLQRIVGNGWEWVYLPPPLYYFP